MTTDVTETADTTQDTEGQAPLGTEEQVEPIEQPEPPQTNWEEAYKGLQRRHERIQSRLKEIEKQVQPQQPQAAIQTGGDPFAAQAQAMATPIYHQKIAQGWSHEQAQEAFGLAYQAAYSSLRYQTLEQVSAQQEAERKADESGAALEQEMRQMAVDEGVDPNDLDLDYGERRSPDVAAKMRNFRQSLRDAKAKVVAQAPAVPRIPPNRSAARVEKSESTGSAKPDAEAKKQAYLRADLDYRSNPATKVTAEKIAQLYREAVEAGAEF